MTTDAELKAIAEKADDGIWYRAEERGLITEHGIFIAAFNPTEALKQLKEKAALAKRVEELEGVLKDTVPYLPAGVPGTIGEEAINLINGRVRKALEGSK